VLVFSGNMDVRRLNRLKDGVDLLGDGHSDEGLYVTKLKGVGSFLGPALEPGFELDVKVLERH